MKGSSDHPSKVGAGLLICCGDEALLLRRSAQCGNPGTWGLPGGNADEEDRGQLLATALREAGEEVGGLPEGLQVAGQVLTRRGKNHQKHYTVFIAHITPEARAAYRPRLNEEHTTWRWLPLPAVRQLAAAPAGAGPAPPPGPFDGGSGGAGGGSTLAAGGGQSMTDIVVLHPVVHILFASHPTEVGALLPYTGPGVAAAAAAAQDSAAAH